jgi:hypothetical protein
MGDRGNIAVEQKYGTVFLYSHWGGSVIDTVLADAFVKGGGRIRDQSYFTRILFNELQGDDRGTTGFGISVGKPDDNEHPIPHVVWPDKGRPVVRVTNELNNQVNEWTADEWLLIHSTSAKEANRARV